MRKLDNEKISFIDNDEEALSWSGEAAHKSVCSEDDLFSMKYEKELRD